MSGSTNVLSSGELTAFDPRVFQVQIQIGDTLINFSGDFWIRAKGRKFANALQNTCDLEISNLDTATRNYLLTETSPFNALRKPKLLNLSVGRVSTGTFLLYSGDITTSKISQPPDITLALKCGTCHSKKGSVGRRSGGKITRLSTLGGAVASNLGLSLRNEAPDVNISNYAHSGNALDEVDKLARNGNCQAYVDDQHLILKQAKLPLSGSVLNLSEKTGMVGVPEITDHGLKVKFLYDSSAKLGGAINLTSILNPAANGLFVIEKLDFDVASRENDFYFTADCIKAQS